MVGKSLPPKRELNTGEGSVHMMAMALSKGCNL